MFVLTTNDKGNIAEAEITAPTIAGIGILRPCEEHSVTTWRLSSRAAFCGSSASGRRLGRRDRRVVRLADSATRPDGLSGTTYSADEIDAVAAYCAELDRCYLLPVHLVARKSSVQLRIAPPRNGQRACLNWASEYELAGAVAQLGERRRGTPEAAGSSPASSTLVTPARTRHGWRPRVPQPLRLVHGARRRRRVVPDHPPRQALRAPHRPRTTNSRSQPRLPSPNRPSPERSSR